MNKSKWTTLFEGLPNNEVIVLTWDGETINKAYWDQYRGKWMSTEYLYKEVKGITHWMDLPESPSELEAGAKG
jgi:hypothetical protein